jgi:hypothetical protein
MGIVDKLQTLAKTELKIIRETAVTTTKTTNATTTTSPAVGLSAEQLLDALETAQKRSIK